MNKFELFLSRIDTIGIFSVLIFFLIKRPKTEGAFFWFIGFVFSMCTFNFVAEVYEVLSIYFKFLGDNLFLYHLACILYVITLSKFFQKIYTSKISKIIDIVFIIPFSILSIINFIYFKRTFTIYSLVSIWVVTKCMFYYSHEFSNPNKHNILHSRLFWIVSGLFLYFSVSFFVFITYDFFTFNSTNYPFQNFPPIWLIQNCILALSCCFFIKAISCKE